MGARLAWEAKMVEDSREELGSGRAKVVIGGGGSPINIKNNPEVIIGCGGISQPIKRQPLAFY